MSFRSIAAVLALGVAAPAVLVVPLEPARAQSAKPDAAIGFGELLMRIHSHQIYTAAIPIPDTIRDESGWGARFTEMLAQGTKIGAEVGVASYYVDRGDRTIFRLIPTIVGKEYSVSIEKLKEAVDTQSGNPGTPLLLLAHTHPSAQTFSTSDIAASAQNRAAVVVINSRYFEMIVPTSPISPTQYYAGYFLGGSAWTDRVQCTALAAGVTTPAGQAPFYDAVQNDMIAAYKLTRYRYDPVRKLWARMQPPAKPELVPFVATYRTAIPDATRMAINQLGVDEAARRIAAGTFGTAIAANMGLKMSDFVVAAAKSQDRFEAARYARVSKSSGLTSQVFPARDKKGCTADGMILLTTADDTKRFFSVHPGLQGFIVTAFQPAK